MAATKVKVSLKDFAMRRKQKKEEMASASAKTTEVPNAHGNYAEPMQMGMDKGSMVTSCKPMKVAVITQSHSSKPTGVAMALCDQKTLSLLPVSKLGLPALNGTIGNTVGTAAQSGSQIDNSRTPACGQQKPLSKDHDLTLSTASPKESWSAIQSNVMASAASFIDDFN